ncbi:hypothetical protein [Massilia rubra]|uniref:hypothetical protein n=1 Tax=Massilia rubra TaxID=2607910 RepID=UPI0014247E02|nr:hypothetical protein [Massilia rubra]
MIPIIGLMIGTYIFTRMLELATSKEAHVAVKLCAIITLVVVAFCTVMLFFAGSQFGRM